MRSPEEQEDFLNQGRFGEGTPGVTVPVAVRAGAILIVVALALLAYPLLFNSGRNEHGGIIYVVSAMYIAIAGVVCFVRELGRRFFARVRGRS